MLGSVIALLHSGQKSHEGDIDPVAFTVIGHPIFIMFREIVNRSEGHWKATFPCFSIAWSRFRYRDIARAP
ncbi:hypothetical protein [Sphingomonas oleivorans]|uniref:hypothetical protein n=1 Tax=Sphingomonas oleivorans TaxID=1735121 RepID=UPI0010570AE3|nr:hypothetical protein [Sphingomonas oleivorans]